jgi:eukaryotic-like serine/threonine-protein kinase
MGAVPSSKIPPLVGRYVLYGEIASGGMATVHFGRLQGAAGFARSVAIKRLHPQFAKDPDFVAMFVDEARLAARIAHPNVVPTLDVVSQEDELLLVMEYVRGTSLSRLLRALMPAGEHVPPRIAAAILSGVLHGLHAAHEARSETGERLDIVHRDVSPQNVLVGTDGVARLLDFGVAKATGRLQSTREGQLKGKIAYMAPEQITTGKVTRKTDLYAAAVVLWETLTARRLFRADNEAKLLSMVLDGEVQPPSELVKGLPKGFDRITLRGLDRDPAKRFATAREMASEIEAVVGTAPSTEVGEWVERVAAEELCEHTSRIEEIERSIASSRPSPSDGSRVRGYEPTGPSRRGDAPSRSRSLAMAHADPPRRGPTRKTIGIAAAVVMCAIGVTVLALRGSRARPDGSVVIAVSSPRPAEVTSATTAAPTSAWTPIPTSTWTGAIPVPTSIPNPTPIRTPIRTGRHMGPVKPPNQPERPDCIPPYTSDSKGHIHFKPECVN